MASNWYNGLPRWAQIAFDVFLVVMAASIPVIVVLALLG